MALGCGVARRRMRGDTAEHGLKPPTWQPKDRMDCTDLLCVSVVVSGGTSPYSRMKSRRRPSMRAIGCSASLRHQTACRITYTPLPLLRPVLALRACDATSGCRGIGFDT